MLTSPKLRRFVKHTLVAATGVANPNHAQVASAFDLLCEQLRARLRPLFGATAINALFARALHLATAEFPWVADAVPKNGERCFVKAPEAASAAVQPTSIAEGLAAVLAHGIGLLTTLIGEDFVVPLVQEAWGATLLSEQTMRSEGGHE
jgi:hypothetical protein